MMMITILSACTQSGKTPPRDDDDDDDHDHDDCNDTAADDDHDDHTVSLHPIKHDSPS